MSRTTSFGVELHPTPPPTAPSIPPTSPHAMPPSSLSRTASDLGSPQASSPPSRNHEYQQLPGFLFGPSNIPLIPPPRPRRTSTPHPSISSSSSSSRFNTRRRRPTFLPPFDFELNSRSHRHHPPFDFELNSRSHRRHPQAHLRPLDVYFGPHLNNDVKRRRAVHEYMLCRVTQELTASFIHHILLVLLSLPTDDENLLDHLVLYAILLRELAALCQYEDAMRASAARAVRTMWSLGLPRRIVTGADAFVRGQSMEWVIFRRAEQPPGLAARFRARYGDSYRSYRDYRYHPTPFRSRRWYAEWREGLGLDQFITGGLLRRSSQRE
ncbi:hypothetical protein PG990_013303 [Apiospora arundinis]